MRSESQAPVPGEATACGTRGICGTRGTSGTRGTCGTRGTRGTGGVGWNGRKGGTSAAGCGAVGRMGRGTQFFSSRGADQQKWGTWGGKSMDQQAKFRYVSMKLDDRRKHWDSSN